MFRVRVRGRVRVRVAVRVRVRVVRVRVGDNFTIRTVIGCCLTCMLNMIDHASSSIMILSIAYDHRTSLSTRSYD